MLRTSPCTERNIVIVPQAPVVVGAASQIVLPDTTGDVGEYALLSIQNVGANDCFFQIGSPCSAISYCGILKASIGQVENFNGRQAVYCYSTSGTTVAVQMLKRNDNASGQGNILQAVR